jgi:hypothetical protein
MRCTIAPVFGSVYHISNPRSRYPHVPAVAKGRKALAKQMTAMGMNQWNLHHHVCENYNPGFTVNNKGSDCTGDHFYHWGGLTGFISLLEAGYYDNPVA